MGSFSMFAPIVYLFFLVIPFVIGYLVIRLAVRHAIDSSQTGKMVKVMYENNMRQRKEED